MKFTEVNPNTFVDVPNGKPAHGRGAWTKTGIGDDYRYHLRKGVRVGNEAEKSLDHWAVSAGVGTIQQRLQDLGHMEAVSEENLGNFGRATEAGVRDFQADNGLSVDGTIGRTDAKVLFQLLIDSNQVRRDIPDNLLRGLIMQESVLDPGAVGYYTFRDSGTFAGIDRGLSQINSEAHPDILWETSFDAGYAVGYSGKRLRVAFDVFTEDYPNRSVAMRWDASVCSHNSPVRARTWLRTGAPSDEAAAYVAAVKKARW